MTTRCKALRLTLFAGLICLMPTVSQAQMPEAQVGPLHADLYARVKVAGLTKPVDLHQSGAKMRLDMTNGGIVQTYITDRDKGILISMTASAQNRLALVFPLDRAEGVVPLPLDLGILARTADLKVVGASLVAGRPCRLIEFANYLNQSGLLCASADNIILSMTRRGSRDPLFVVQDITTGPQDPKWFRTPPDYQIAVIPGIGGASAALSAPPAPVIAKPK
jgi:hypothetical protein